MISTDALLKLTDVRRKVEKLNQIGLFEEQYTQLYNKYPQTLSCPCTKISISYETFLHIKHSLHQICGSDFTTPAWIKRVSEFSYDITWRRDDFRLISGNTFQSVKILCDLITTTISYGLNQFYTSDYISGFVGLV